MKTEVYSWRLSRPHKEALEEAAREEDTSVAELLDRVTDEWIRSRRARQSAEASEQARLRADAMRFVGGLHGGDPSRSSRVRELVRAKLARRRGR